jgi:hypothetical protein
MVEGMDEDDIATWPTQPTAVDHLTVLSSNTARDMVVWSIHRNGGWQGHYKHQSNIIERITADGYYWIFDPRDDAAGHVPHSACPEAFAELYEAIIRSYTEKGDR